MFKDINYSYGGRHEKKACHEPMHQPDMQSYLFSKKAGHYEGNYETHYKRLPNVLGMLAFFKSSSESPTADCQAFPNKKGAYHSPPITKAETAATKTAR
ncbi:MAG: hypothetical protein ACUZ8O_00040 [Candidatus Anammoxibacter sp.]